MPDPGDIIGQAVVNVRTCVNDLDGVPCCLSPYGATDGECPGCQGDGTWLDTSGATMVEQVDESSADPHMDGSRTVSVPKYRDRPGQAVVRIPAGYDLFWRPVENGDTDEP